MFIAVDQAQAHSGAIAGAVALADQAETLLAAGETEKVCIYLLR